MRKLSSDLIFCFADSKLLPSPEVLWAGVTTRGRPWARAAARTPQPTSVAVVNMNPKYVLKIQVEPGRVVRL